MADYAFDINEVMRRIDTKDYDYFLSMGDDDINKLTPLILMRWKSCLPYDGFKQQCDNLLNINSKANCGLWGNAKDKRLFLLSLCAISSGKYRKHGYFGRKKEKPKAADKKKQIVRGFRKDLTDAEFETFYSELSKDELNDYLNLEKI